MERIDCNLCKSGAQRVVYEIPDDRYFPDERFRVVECAECGLGFVNPRPTFEEMGKYYPSAFYEFFDEDPRHQAKRYATEAAFLEGAPGRRLLDVGCANGDFPRFMARRGWTVAGVEVSKNSKPIDDFPVTKVPFPDMPASDARYDVVTAWAVLEHVHDPMAYFRKAAAVLEHAGLFVFLVTNFHSLASRRLFGEDVPRHLTFFTEPAVRRYLATVGLELVSATYGDAIYPMRPVNWTRWVLARLARRELRFEDLPMTRARWLAARGLRNDVQGIARYVVANPLSAVDRALLPLVERIEIATRRYGIVTYVARKP